MVLRHGVTRCDWDKRGQKGCAGRAMNSHHTFYLRDLATSTKMGQGNKYSQSLKLKNRHSALKVGNSVITWRGKSNFRLDSEARSDSDGGNQKSNKTWEPIRSCSKPSPIISVASDSGPRFRIRAGAISRHPVQNQNIDHYDQTKTHQTVHRRPWLQG